MHFPTGLNITTRMNDFKQKEKNNNSVVGMSFLEPDNTIQLLRNVFKEMQQFSKNNYLHNENKAFVNIHNSKQKISHPNINMSQDSRILFRCKTKYLHNAENMENKRNEMSFTFLLNQQSQEITASTHGNENNYSVRTFRNLVPKQNSFCIDKVTNSDLGILYQENEMDMDSLRKKNHLDSMAIYNDRSLLDFKPNFVSTPKNKTKENEVGDCKRHTQMKRNRNRSLQKIYARKEMNSRNFNFSNQVTNSSKKVINTKKYIKQRSISSRLFDAINDSCTTFVKSVKNLFKTKSVHDDVRDQEENQPSTIDNLQSSCSYSFTNYMRQRDDIRSTEKQTFKSIRLEHKKTSKFCKTCNDTGTLKRKVNDNSYLKETVKKLKLGINLYGCDFKVIFH